MSEEEVKGWLNKRKFLKGRVTNLENSLGDITSVDSVSDLESALDRLNDFGKRFEDIAINLEAVDEGKYKAENLNFETKHYTLTKTIRKAIEALKGRRRTAELNDSFVRSDSQALTLPKINIPSFTGKYTEWLNFKDLFVNLIHSNGELPKIRKFYYLKGALKQDAASIIANIECTENNYTRAWDAVLKRFDNKVLIANSHFKCLFDLQKVSKNSGSGLRTLLNEFSQHYNSLDSLGLPNLLDAFLIYFLSQKLDFNTQLEFELQRKSDEFPTIPKFVDYLNQRCQAWEISTRIQNNSSSKSDRKSVSCTTLESRKEIKQNRCPLCTKPHSLVKCFKFIGYDVNRRRRFVEANQLCFNCLGRSHLADKCSADSCNRCGNKHHRMLHLSNTSKTDSQFSESKQAENRLASASTSAQVPNVKENVTLCSSLGADKISNESMITENYHSLSMVLMATALVNVVDSQGHKVVCRVLLDSASERNFVCSNLIKKLNVSSQKSNWLVSGVGGRTAHVNSVVSLIVESRTTDFKFNAEFGVLDSITEHLPKRSFDKKLIRWPSFIRLADPGFNLSGPIDMLIGSSLFFSILQKGRVYLGPSNPILHNTSLGWVLGGRVDFIGEAERVTNASVTALASTSDDLNQSLIQFWKMEEYDSKPSRSSDENLCEKLFVDGVSRDSSGRYEVNLPIIEDRLRTLGDSYNLAYRRLVSLERKFRSNPGFFNDYKTFIEEFLSLGHACEINCFPSPSTVEYYMPHHAVLKDSSSSTKLRVVFDASAPSSSGVSLNDIMLVGPVVQSDLMTILIRFRTYIFAIITDIAKMYRQIKVKKKYQALQRILWRNSPNENVKCLQLNRVTYGTASASYLATRSLLQLVQDEGAKLPLASRAIEHNTYIDDIMTGAQDLNTAIRMQEELMVLLGKGQFELHKWYTNNSSLLNRIPENQREKCSFQFCDGSPAIKTLGLVWNPHDDIFQIQVPDEIFKMKNTKREVLACIAKLFDPLGLVAPVVVSAKILMQMLWREKLNWDDEIPNNIVNIWIPLKDSFIELRKMAIPRLILKINASSFQLHGFADSSMKAYGCAIYLKSSDYNGNSIVRLICAKSRVAPIKPVTLPRLELCACLLLSRFMKVTRQGLPVTIEKTFYWTDNMIAMAWIKSDASRWAVFVANRVSEIQEVSAKEDWNHVASGDNPADVVSRGLDPRILRDCDLWWNGPPWLVQAQELWPRTNNCVEIKDLPEAKCASLVSNTTPQSRNCFIDWFERFSSFTRLQRSFVYVMRFCIYRKRPHKTGDPFGRITALELNESFKLIVRIVQQNYFSKELGLISKFSEDPSCVSKLNTTKLKFLSPFVDNDGILRVGGRLKHCLQISENQRFPAILPCDSHVTKLIIIREHENLLHAGAQATLASLRLRVWVINGRNAVRQIIHKCTRCYRFVAKPAEQIMADLPSVRVSPARPFLNVGLDYGGPINIKQIRIRKPLITKGYICLFVCMVTKALHLELVSDMSTKAFLNALYRFFARRGKSAKIFSDNGTNFRGAHNELVELHKLLNNRSSVSIIYDKLAGDGVDWNFIPPFAPHWGGIWESGIKSVKFHLKRMIGNTTLTYEELNTALCECEAILNSRPLCPISSDPNDCNPLTPAHFLINDTLTSLPEQDVVNIPTNKLSVWNQIRQIKQIFWKKWSNEYLSNLQQRSKWLQERPDLKVGTMVLVKEAHSPPLCWNLARVIEPIKGPDGRVRSAKIKSKGGNYYIRPISKLCPLPEN